MSTVIDANPASPAAEAPVKKNRGKQAKDPHPAIADGGKLDHIPEDFGKYATLKEDNFTAAARPLFYRWKADQLEATVVTLRSKADRAERLGGIEDTKTAQAMDKHFEALMKSYEKLKAQGVADDAFDPRMLLMLGINQPETPAAA